MNTKCNGWFLVGLATLVCALPLTSGCDKGAADKPATNDVAKTTAATGSGSTTKVAPKVAPKPIEVSVEAKSDSKLTGTATLSTEGDGVKVVLKLQNVPAGKHGAHVHEKGDCSAPDGKSAGGHFNPDKIDHGLPSNKRHLGDLGNIEIGEDGTGKLEITVAGANLKAGDAKSFLGRAIIVHAKEDDGGQPTGNAGGRIGCAVIAAK